eukprot:CAMPEP_0115292492 /NCGR_PEP_ID=MMETSP0270-20121206/65162_1 /TAXON_ID=71861 /ORGANISM="Scrippsiella trochoidea, Strain CCMP3099" /LENGTH=159 /DNA_ID=CAMNT_0002709923 /DNA_START=110 /DNA_END=590 /DNA_ORIENTATION=+
MADDLNWMLRRGGLSQANKNSVAKCVPLRNHAPAYAATLDHRGVLLTDRGNEQSCLKSVPHIKTADRPSGGGDRLRPGTPPAHVPPHHAPPLSRAAEPGAPAAPLGPLPPPAAKRGGSLLGALWWDDFGFAIVPGRLQLDGAAKEVVRKAAHGPEGDVD